MYSYDRRTAFANPYAQNIKDVERLGDLIADDLKILEANEKAQAKQAEDAMALLKELFELIQDDPHVDRADQVRITRLLTQEKRDIARNLSSSSELWVDTSRLADVVRKLVDAMALPELVARPIWKRVKDLIDLRAKREHLGREFDEIEALFKKLRFTRPETDEEAEVNSHLDRIRDLYLEDRPNGRKIDALIDSIVDTLKVGNPNQMQLRL